MLGGMPSSRFLASLIAALAAVAVVASAAPARAAAPTPYTRAVEQVCAHALLFEGSHAMGTRAGALDVAADIRASALRRLTRVASVPPPLGKQHSVARWLLLERRLAEAYALTYVRIYDLIAAPRTAEQLPETAHRLQKLVHAPDRLRAAVAHLEQQLRVPDCTGG